MVSMLACTPFLAIRYVFSHMLVGRPCAEDDLRKAHRLFVALLLLQLVQEVEHKDVAKKFSVDAGAVRIK